MLSCLMLHCADLVQLAVLFRIDGLLVGGGDLLVERRDLQLQRVQLGVRACETNIAHDHIQG